MLLAGAVGKFRDTIRAKTKRSSGRSMSQTIADVNRDHALIRRIRTLTLGLMTPFYFIRARSFVSVPALIAAPIAFLALLLGKMTTSASPQSPNCSGRPRRRPCTPRS
jgi:hypothetical protein